MTVTRERIIHRRNRKCKPGSLRFEKYVHRNEGGCWNWLGGTSGRPSNRHGVFRATKDRSVPAYKFSWELFNSRTVPVGLELHHTCKNRMCVNPEHLMLVTSTQHHEIEPRSLPKERCIRGHKLSPDNRVSQGCRMCHNLRSKLYRRSLRVGLKGSNLMEILNGHA